MIEIKLGGDELINDGAYALKTLADKIDTTKMKKLVYSTISYLHQFGRF